MTDKTIEVPERLIKTVYAIMVGMCIEKELNPNECGYISSGWKAKEELRELLGYDGGDEDE